jgi:hypothetical protein
VNAVRTGMIAAGVDSARIATSFVGKSGLLNAEKDVRDLALNRRVEFKYFDKTGAPIATTKQTQDIQVETVKPKATPHAKAPVKKAAVANPGVAKPGAAKAKAPAAQTKAPAPTPAPAPEKPKLSTGKA